MLLWPTSGSYGRADLPRFGRLAGLGRRCALAHASLESSWSEILERRMSPLHTAEELDVFEKPGARRGSRAPGSIVDQPRLQRCKEALRDGDLLLRSDLSRVADDHPKIDGVAHGSVAGPVGVNLFARPARRGIRLEFRAQLARSRVGRDGVEIDHAVEDAGRADEAVELLALRVDFGRAVRRHAAVERAD